MKKLAACLFTLCLTTCAAAQPEVASFSVGGGLTHLFGPEHFADRYNTGFGFGATGGYVLPSGVELTADVSYSRLSLDEDAFLEGAALSILSGSVGTRFHVADLGAVSPYALLRAGLRHLRIGAGEATEDGVVQPFEEDSRTEPGAAVGIGALLSFSPQMGLFAETAFESIFTENDATLLLPVRIGLTFLIQ